MLSDEVQKTKHECEEMDMTDAKEEDQAAKFAQQKVPKMSCGNITDFSKGLSGRIGDPSFDFENAMQAEHCHTRDSNETFRSRNYGVQTCPHNEWQITVKNDTSNADMGHGRVVRKVDEMLELALVKGAKLNRVEVIAVVLYTGPMFEKYNCMLRRFGNGPRRNTSRWWREGRRTRRRSTRWCLQCRSWRQ